VKADSESGEKELLQLLQERFGSQDFRVPPGLDGIHALVRLAGHVSTRRWGQQVVSPDLIRLLAACSLCAPSKSYLQQADIIHVATPEQRAAVMALMTQWPWMEQAPAFLVFCGNGMRFEKLFESAGAPFVNDHLDAFFNCAVDASLVLMNFVSAAEAVGMVTCPISVVRNQAAKLADVLNLPPRVFPVAGLCVGFPADRATVNPRLRLSSTFHVDRHAGDASEEDIAEFDARYVASRSATAGSESRRWSDERISLYDAPQREDWGSYIRSIGFDLR